MGGAAQPPATNYRSAVLFQSQGRFFGGCCTTGRQVSPCATCFNRRGDSLGGAAKSHFGAEPLLGLFQSQGRFFGGCCRPMQDRPPVVYPFQSQGRFFGGCCLLRRNARPQRMSFNRRGDSLGGAAMCRVYALPLHRQFQSQGRFFGGCCIISSEQISETTPVSIAGAILWGVLPGPGGCYGRRSNCFNRRGASLGGAA